MVKIFFKPDTRPFNVMSLSREDFDRIEIKPDNYLFFVLDKIVKGESIVNVYSLYKGNVQVGVGDIIGSLPDSMKASNGGFRAMAFTRSEGRPEKPRESDFGTYYDLVNSKQAWQSRPDNLSGTGQIWVSFHWFTGSPAESLDTGDTWTDPVRLTGLNGADGKDGLNGADGRDGENGRDGSNGKDGENGTGVFIRFNSSVSEPERPTGMGIDGGWSSNQKEDSRWISLKQGKTASDGKWGEPVQIKCNLIRYDASDGSIRDEFGNFLGMAFSPVYSIDTEQVIPLTVLDRYKFDTSTPLRVNCYVSTPQGSRALLNPEDYELMCKVRDSRTNPIEEKTFALEYANKEWLLPLEDWYDKSNATDFIELHLFAKNGEAGSGALAIKLIQLVRDGEAGKITSVKAETLAPGSQATVRNEGDIHDAKLVIGIPRGDKGERGDPFMINRTYPSVAAMNADFGNANVPLFAMVLIDTGNVEDEENAKLYIKNTTGFQFLTDLSGAQGIQGPQGATFTPSVSAEGELSWTNDKGLDNPAPVNIKGPKGATGETGKAGSDGLNFYISEKEVSDDTLTDADSRDYFPSRWYNLKVGEIFLSKDLNLYKITRVTIELNSGTSPEFDAKKVGSIKGEQGERGEKGDTGAQGLEGLGIFRSSSATTLTTTSIALSTITIPTGRSVKVGDLIIANNTYSYLYQVTAVSSTTATVSYKATLRGATGAAGSDASVEIVQELGQSSTAVMSQKAVSDFHNYIGSIDATNSNILLEDSSTLNQNDYFTFQITADYSSSISLYTLLDCLINAARKTSTTKTLLVKNIGTENLLLMDADEQHLYNIKSIVLKPNEAVEISVLYVKVLQQAVIMISDKLKS